MIGVIDYQAGNTRSVINALKQIQVESLLTSQPKDLDFCDGVILPGVGSAGSAMNQLNQSGLTEWLRNTEKPVLGICLGFQLLFEFSQEGDVETLGLIEGHVQHLRQLAIDGDLDTDPDRSLAENDVSRTLRVPHMGWNEAHWVKPSPLQVGCPDKASMYFAHSYAVKPGPATLAVTDGFCSVVQKDHFFGVQFHPEKSARPGLRLLQNFEALCKSSPPWI